MKKWVCPVCGYVHEGDVPPAECPVCHVSGEKFLLQSEEKSWAAEHVVGVGKVFGDDVPEEVRQEIIDGLRRCRRLSVYGVSIGGAAAHNLGQMAAACITLGNTMVLGYLPFLLAVSLVTGTLTGFVAGLLFRAMRNIHLSY